MLQHRTHIVTTTSTTNTKKHIDTVFQFTDRQQERTAKRSTYTLRERMQTSGTRTNIATYGAVTSDDTESGTQTAARTDRASERHSHMV